MKSVGESDCQVSKSKNFCPEHLKPGFVTASLTWSSWWRRKGEGELPSNHLMSRWHLNTIKGFPITVVSIKVIAIEHGIVIIINLLI